MSDSSSPHNPPLFTQVDISAGSPPPVGQVQPGGDAAETNRLLRDMVLLQHKSCELLTELLAQVSLQHRQRTAELKAWKEANPQLARSCRRAAESLAKVHTEFLSTLAQEAADNADDFSDSEYALGEFIDRYGPRLAHFNGVLQLFAQLGAAPPAAETPTEG
jgi:thiamine pyrophosphate-dependent acetolactate synthase large subunit-like protein